jgi:hypothetical protein
MDVNDVRTMAIGVRAIKGSRDDHCKHEETARAFWTVWALTNN